MPTINVQVIQVPHHVLNYKFKQIDDILQFRIIQLLATITSKEINLDSDVPKSRQHCRMFSQYARLQ